MLIVIYYFLSNTVAESYYIIFDKLDNRIPILSTWSIEKTVKRIKQAEKIVRG